MSACMYLREDERSPRIPHYLLGLSTEQIHRHKKLRRSFMPQSRKHTHTQKGEVPVIN